MAKYMINKMYSPFYNSIQSYCKFAIASAVLYQLTMNHYRLLLYLWPHQLLVCRFNYHKRIDFEDIPNTIVLESSYPAIFAFG